MGLQYYIISFNNSKGQTIFFMFNYSEFEKRGVVKEELSGIKNIIFDLGNVIIDIYFEKTIDDFKKLGFTDFDSIYSQIKQTRIFDLLETGKIPPQAFRMELRKFRNHLTDEQIDQAWSSMIGDMPAAYISLLSALKKNYKVFLLSNTNAIHIDFFIRYLNRKYGYNPLPGMFDYMYFSHEIGYRKPELEAYEHVLRDAGIRASETLFIDDLELNISGARKAGLHTLQLTGCTLASLFIQN